MATPDPSSVPPISGDTQAALQSFQGQVAPQIAAIQSAARALIAKKTAGGAPTRNVHVEIGVGAKDGPGLEADATTQCWEADVICGKGETGYIHCTVKVCMEVGPVTVSK